MNLLRPTWGRAVVLADSAPATVDGLSVDGLEVSYAGVPAVRGIDLDVPAGHAIGLIGPNGAGKSSALL